MKHAFLYLILLGALVACKSVQVLVPAAYPLAGERALVMGHFSGAHGDDLSWRIVSRLKANIPGLPVYSAGQGAEGGVIMQGEVQQLGIGDPVVTWGHFDEHNLRQHGTVSRSGRARLRVMLVRPASGEVVWADSFTSRQSESRHFSLASPEDMRKNGVARSVRRHEEKDALEDMLVSTALEQLARNEAPSRDDIRQRLLDDLAMQVSHKLYDRVETRLEFR